MRDRVYENVIFCWVMHKQGIIDEILSKLETSGCLIHNISLLCRSEELRKRLQKNVDRRIRRFERFCRKRGWNDWRDCKSHR